METTDFLVVGGGVMGITIATQIKRHYSDARVVLIEKEPDIALHASGRNSGVLHSGFYYSADSMKARFTLEGNRAMHAFCEEKGLRINKCGKLVVCQNEGEVEGLHELARRGKANGVNLDWITPAQAIEIEPNVRTHEAALWSRDTASVDPLEVVNALADDARALGVQIRTGTAYIGRRQNRTTEKVGIIKTDKGEIEAGYLINAAGLYADKIAGDFGFSKNYRILPFKGLYLYSAPGSYKPRVHIYPVPDLQHPFLGVHFTLTVDGLAKIGPTAIPAFWRENYRGFDDFDGREAVEIVAREMKMWLHNSFGFRQLAFREMQKYRKSFMIEAAEKMLQGAKAMGFTTWGRPGIRAQLVDIMQNRLEMDFIYEGDASSFHLLNAVSPAFTCALPISQYLAGKIGRLIDNNSAHTGGRLHA